MNNILKGIDSMMIESNSSDSDSEFEYESKICQMIKAEFQAESFVELFSSFHGIQREVGLMVLQQAVPSLAERLNQISKLPLDKFKSKKKVSNYLEAVIKSGVAANIDHGIVFLVGNTGVGKSSLANTLKAYIEKPSDHPSSILAGTGQHKKLIETQVLEVYKDVPFQRDEGLSINVTSSGEGPDLVDFVENVTTSTKETKEDKKVIKIRLVDMGGHQEQRPKNPFSRLASLQSNLPLLRYNTLSVSGIVFRKVEALPERLGSPTKVRTPNIRYFVAKL